MRIGYHRSKRGFSLIELMIALAIAMVIAGAMTGIFVSSTKMRSELDRVASQIETGRFAMDFLNGDIRLAGFWGEYDRTSMIWPAALPANPCTTDVALLKADLPVHVQGYDGYEETSNTVPCISDIKAKSDVLVIRRAGTCATVSAGCNAFQAGAVYFQPSLCLPAESGGAVAFGKELSSPDLADFIAVGTAAADLALHKKDCVSLAPIRPYIVHIYYLANNNEPGDGVPTLKRAELGYSGGGVSFTQVSIVPDINELQFEYGIDSTGDGITDSWMAAPADLTAWSNVVAVRAHVIARARDASADYTDRRTYELGADADGKPNTRSYEDKYRRHSYASVIKLINPAGFRE